MKNPQKKYAGDRFGIRALNPKLELIVISSLLIQLLLLTFALFASNQLMLKWAFSPVVRAQSSNIPPVDVTEFDGGVLIEWTLPPEILAELNSDEPFNSFVEAGWETELLDHIKLPAYTIPLWEIPLEEGEIAPSSEEIIALIDVLASRSVTLTIETKTMPTQTLPSGDELPFISPLASPESLAPTEPIYILREGMQRGERQFVIAVSPIYMDGEQIEVATRGSATLTGVFIKQNQPRAGQEAEESGEEEERLTEEVPETGADQTEREADAGNLATSPLSSPLANPTDARQSMPLNSPLPAPIPSVIVQAEDGNPTDSSGSTEQQPQVISPLEGPIDEAAQPTPLSDEPPLQSAPSQRPITPWSGLLTFAFFGLALIYILASRQN